MVSRVNRYSTAAVDVTWRPLVQPEEVRLGEPATVQGGTPAFRSFTTELPDPALGAEASCSEPVQMYRLGAGTASAWGEDPPLITRDRSAVLPLNVGAGRHVVVLASADGRPVDCTLTIRPFESQALSGFGAHDLLIDDDVGAGVYATALPEDGVLAAEPRTDVVLTTVCRDAAPEASTLRTQRVLTYLPRDGECAVWVSSVNPAAGAGQRIWLAPTGPDGGE